MVCVGDSEDVHLFEVIDGGREFHKVTTYKGTSRPPSLPMKKVREGLLAGATDSGFSTAWSRDGRKFAVAAQGSSLHSSRN
jgi:hypothetical protein